MGYEILILKTHCTGKVFDQEGDTQKSHIGTLQFLLFWYETGDLEL
jgi:hypothetical protein